MLLAVDTSTQSMGLCLYEEPTVIAEITWKSINHHTVELAPALEELIKRSGRTAMDIQAIGIALGPGSFTSLRIGLALAKGMALSLHIPLIGIPTFDILVHTFPQTEHPLIAVLPAGRQRMAAQIYHVVAGNWKASSELQVLTTQEISDLITVPTHICGEMDAEDRQVVGRKWKNAKVASPVTCTRRPAALAEIAWNRWKSGLVDDPISLSPIYLHVAGNIQE
jgi:tRNA threonylcarbamoyladenosine biosynthesis protein TsaB